MLRKYHKSIQLILKLESFGLNIQEVSGVDNVISDTPSSIPIDTKNQSYTITTRDIYQLDEPHNYINNSNNIIF